MATVEEAAGALAYLEKKFGSIPSVEQVAEQMNVSVGTAHKMLKRAVKQKLIVQRQKKFMTLKTARWFDQLT